MIKFNGAQKICLTAMLFCLCMLGLSIYKYYQYTNIQKNGKVISVVVTWREECVLTDVNYYFRFNYEGKEWTEIILPKNCDSFKVGDIVQLIHKDGDSNFLFTNDTNLDAEIGVVAFSLFSLICMAFMVKARNED